MLTYPATHWGASPDADLIGTETSPGADVIQHMGWFYRLDGDTRERPFPPPDFLGHSLEPERSALESGRLVAIWFDLGGSGLHATEITDVFDNERPSGGIGISMTLYNLGSTARRITLFHYLDPSVGGTAARDEAVSLAPGYVKFTDGANVMRYQCTSSSCRHRVVNTTRLLEALNDGDATDLADILSPVGRGDLRAAFQTDTTVPAGSLQSVTVRLSSRLSADHVRAAGLASNPSTYPPLLVRWNDGTFGATGRRRHEPLAFDLRLSLPPAEELIGVDDFDGNFVDEPLTHSTITGQFRIEGRLVQGTPPPSWRVAATGDFDHDGRADLLWQDGASGSLIIWRMDGHERLGTIVPNPPQATDANWAVVGVGDFNLDRNLDLLFSNRNSGSLVLWFMDENQERILGTFTDPPGLGGHGWRVVAVGDYGKGVNGSLNTADIVWQNDVSRQVVIWHMTAEERTSGVLVDMYDPYLGGIPKVIGPR